jgi:hypothetical protein
MMMKNIKSMAIVICITVSLIFISGSNAQDAFYFSHTGHSISGNFLDFFLSIPNVEKLFGSPITDVFIGELGNNLQYFENVRLEEDAFGKISLSPIGKLAYSPGNEAIDHSSLLSCQQPAGWQFSVCFDFLDFYNEHGRESIIGKPISGMEKEHGRIVQFFENMVLEWTPDDEEYNVQVGELGFEYFIRKGENKDLLLPNIPNISEYEILDLNAQIFIEHALLESGEVQTLYVHVADQNGVPVAGVNIFTTLTYSQEQEKTQEIPAGVTDEYGMSVIYFICEINQMENVRVITTLNYETITIHSETSFKINY